MKVILRYYKPVLSSVPCIYFMQNKRTAFKTCRDLEVCWDQLKDARSSRSANEKDAHKLEKSCRKLEESLMKADREYRDSNIKTEHSRLNWESAMYQCCKVGVVGVWLV